VLRGDALDRLRELADGSIDALVTDPPAGIAFMGKAFDTYSGRAAFVAALTPIFAECLRVLKPGAHGLVWALPRTSHWTATALEDAGFEVRDRVSAMFGSGFPKSLDVSKAIDKAAGAEREVVGYGTNGMGRMNQNNVAAGYRPNPYSDGVDGVPVTASATDAAKQWDGWGTALKPACEDWWLVRKPCAEKTVAANVVKHGTGALNIGACRIATTPGDETTNHARSEAGAVSKGVYNNSQAQETHQTDGQKLGRWPAHVVLSHSDECAQIGTHTVTSNGHHPAARGMGSVTCGPSGHTGQDGLEERHAQGESVETWACPPWCAVRMLDAQSGTSKSTGGRINKKTVNTDVTYEGGWNEARKGDPGLGDIGGASRFYYIAKPSTAEREAGCESLTAAQQDLPRKPDAPGANNPRNRGGGARLNNHPTVKSIGLMRWLARLITPPGGVVLDPFGGSGTTGCAAVLEGFRPIIIEREPAYADIADARIAYWTAVARVDLLCAASPPLIKWIDKHRNAVMAVVRRATDTSPENNP